MVEAVPVCTELDGDGPFDTRQAACRAFFATKGWTDFQRLHSGVGYFALANKEQPATVTLAVTRVHRNGGWSTIVLARQATQT